MRVRRKKKQKSKRAHDRSAAVWVQDGKKKVKKKKYRKFRASRKSVVIMWEPRSMGQQIDDNEVLQAEYENEESYVFHVVQWNVGANMVCIWILKVSVAV